VNVAITLVAHIHIHHRILAVFRIQVEKEFKTPEIQKQEGNRNVQEAQAR
jgi:hypothetical protein